MTTQQLLLANIICTPEGDTERLVYADYVEEQGQGELAEFIRLGVALHRFNNADPNNLFISDWDDARVQKDRYDALWGKKIHESLVQIGETTWYCSPFPKSCPEVWIQEWSRGFCEEIRYPAQDFLEMADALIWHEGMTDECPECNGQGDVGTLIGRMGCTKCSTGPYTRGTGRVPRPCPLTAHPIRKVVLTTWPHLLTCQWDDTQAWYCLGTVSDPCNQVGPFERNSDLDRPDETHREVLHRRWPGIEFVLPESDPEQVFVPDAAEVNLQ